MRTTLNIDDDLLIAVKEMAQRESKSAGDVVSALLRESLTGGADGPAGLRDVHAPYGAPVEAPDAAFGFRPFPKRGGVVTNAAIDRLREETGT